MLKITNRAGLSIWIFMYILQIVLLGLLIALSITRPQNNLFPWQMAIGTTLGTILLATAFFLWDRPPCRKIKQSLFIYIILLMLYGILLYGISCIGRNALWSMGDYERTWNTALELSEGAELSEEWYFKIYANNIKPMLYLSVLFRAARLFHFSDPFYFILIISVLQVLGAVWSVGVLVGNSREERAQYRIPILLLFAFTLPIWANVQAFYTDSMSFAMGIIVLALIKLCFETTSRIRIVLLLFLAGMLAGFGISIKITIFIPVIAGFIVFCFTRPSPLKWDLIGIFFICTLIGYELTSLWAGNFAIWNAAKETAEPIVDWIAIGMNGSGSYPDNQEYILYVTNLPSKQDKIDYTLGYIWENRSAFWNVTHLIRKIRFNFASGNFGAEYFSLFSLEEHNLIWELFSPYGKHFWRTSQICFCYIFSLYTVYMLGAAASLYRLIKRKELFAIKAIADLALLGNIVFLMIWEANHRLLYNQIPIIILGAVMNIRLLLMGKTGVEKL